MSDTGPVSVDVASRKYRVLLELGQGGTANVFLAVARGPAGFNKLVVLKALKRTIANDSDSRRMFLAEARLSARLNHPNIVQVNEVTEQDNVPVIVMEYLEGQPLSQIIARGPESFTLAMHLRIISDALSGLHYSHELTDYDGTALNVVHRDMTPQNVFVTFDGVVKVLDFGIAKLAGTAGDTQTGVIKGKLRYMPPEQIVGDQIDRRADIFAVGAMLWEAGTGERIWRDMGEATIMNRVINGEIPPPRSVRPDCPVELERICMKAMSHNREERYRSALELQIEVEQLISKLGEQLTTHELGERVAEWFADVREETRRIVEKKLTQEGSLSLTGAGKISFAPSYAGDTALSPGMEAPAKRSRAGLVLLALALVLIASLAVWGIALRQAEVVAGPAPPRPSATASAAPKSDMINVRVTVFPVSASIYKDDEPVHANPYNARLDRDGSSHTIRAEARGHRPATRKIELNRDVEMVIVLEPEKPAEAEEKETASKPRPRPQPRVIRRAPPPKPAPTPKGPDCSSPYYVDERGVKKYRPECL